jgi:hypothetical protein
MAEALYPGCDVARGYPLYHINAFSNADKHRLMAIIFPKVADIEIISDPPNAVADIRPGADPVWWTLCQ